MRLFKKYFSHVHLGQREVKCTLRNEKPRFFRVHMSRIVSSAAIQSPFNLKWVTMKHGFPVPGGV